MSLENFVIRFQAHQSLHFSHVSFIHPRDGLRPSSSSTRDNWPASSRPPRRIAPVFRNFHCGRRHGQLSFADLRPLSNYGGADAVLTMTNFSPREFNTIWSSMFDHMTRSWNVGRGKRSQFAAKDVFSMMLLVFKNGGMWNLAARVFNVATPTFIQKISKFLRVAAPKLCDEQVEKRAYEDNMRFLATSECTFRARFTPRTSLSSSATALLVTVANRTRFTAASTIYMDWSWWCQWTLAVSLLTARILQK